MVTLEWQEAWERTDDMLQERRMPDQFDIRIRVFREEPAFGKGVVQLLDLIRQENSFSASCRRMGMAPSKAWKIVRRAEADLGTPLIRGESGGSGGGRTVLTEEGADLLDRYHRFEREIMETAKKCFSECFH